MQLCYRYQLSALMSTLPAYNSLTDMINLSSSQFNTKVFPDAVFYEVMYSTRLVKSSQNVHIIKIWNINVKHICSIFCFVLLRNGLGVLILSLAIFVLYYCCILKFPVHFQCRINMNYRMNDPCRSLREFNFNFYT